MKIYFHNIGLKTLTLNFLVTSYSFASYSIIFVDETQATVSSALSQETVQVVEKSNLESPWKSKDQQLEWHECFPETQEDMPSQKRRRLSAHTYYPSKIPEPVKIPKLDIVSNTTDEYPLNSFKATQILDMFPKSEDINTVNSIRDDTDELFAPWSDLFNPNCFHFFISPTPSSFDTLLKPKGAEPPLIFVTENMLDIAHEDKSLKSENGTPATNFGKSIDDLADKKPDVLDKKMSVKKRRISRRPIMPTGRRITRKEKAQHIYVTQREKIADYITIHPELSVKKIIEDLNTTKTVTYDTYNCVIFNKIEECLKQYPNASIEDLSGALKFPISKIVNTLKKMGVKTEMLESFKSARKVSWRKSRARKLM